MGRGNWRPCNDMEERGCMYVYIDINEDNEEGDCSENYNYLKETIIGYLSKSFDEVNEGERHFNDYIYIIARNKLFEVFTADNEYSVVVGICVSEDAPAFAKSNLYGVCKQLFNELNKLYDVSIRTGPWTSGKYVEME